MRDVCSAAADGEPLYVPQAVSIPEKSLFFYMNASDLRNSVTIEMVGGFCSVLEPQGYLIDILLSPRTCQEDNLVQLAEKYAGFAIGTFRLDPMTILTLDKLAIPHLFIKNYLPERNDPKVRINYFRAGFLAAEHLKKCGCKTLAIVNPEKRWLIADDFFNGVSAGSWSTGSF